MRRLSLRLKRFVRGLYQLGEEQNDRRGLILFFNIIALIGAFLSAPSAIRAAETVVVYGFIGLLLISLFFALRHQMWLARIVAPVATFIFITRLLYGGGIHDDALGGYYLLLIYVGMVLDQRALLFSGIMSTIVIVIIGTAETSGLIQTRFGPLTERVTIATSAFFMLGATTALYILVTRLNRTLSRSQHNELAQAEANRQLRELKAELEVRVDQRTHELDFANQQLQTQLDRVSALQAKLREEAIRDPLTGLFNRRYLSEMLPIELARARRAVIPITLMLVDVDHFKGINDTFGHQVGDHVLQEMGNLLKMNTRAGDIVCRYGGEEFLIVLPGMKNGDARARAEKLRTMIESQTLLESEHGIRLTVSIGAAIYPEDGETHAALISVADHSLYRAKQTGRNRVEFPPSKLQPT